MRFGGNARRKNGGKFEFERGDAYGAGEREQQHERGDGGKRGVGSFAGMSGVLRAGGGRRPGDGDAIDIAADDHELEHTAPGLAPERGNERFPTRSCNSPSRDAC